MLSASSKPQEVPGRHLTIKELILSTAAVCVLFLGLNQGLQAVRHSEHRAHHAPGGYEYPQKHDLMIAAVSTLALIILRVTFAYLLHPIGEIVIPHKKKWDPQTRRDRVERFSAVVFKFMYFCFTTFLCWNTFAHADFFIPAFGGTGTTQMIWKGYPYQHIFEGQKVYYLIQLGYHCHSLFFTVIMKHRNDFLEMSLHHLCAIFLVLLSYCYNFHRIGILVLFLHDVGDVFSYAIKATADTNYTSLTLTLYVFLLLSWGYMRLYVFPRCVLLSVWVEAYEYCSWSWWVFSNLLLWCLQCLHIYWYCLFLLMGYNYTKKGTTQDIQDKIPSRGTEICKKYL